MFSVVDNIFKFAVNYLVPPLTVKIIALSLLSS